MYSALHVQLSRFCLQVTPAHVNFCKQQYSYLPTNTSNSLCMHSTCKYAQSNEELIFCAIDDCINSEIEIRTYHTAVQFYQITI